MRVQHNGSMRKTTVVVIGNGMVGQRFYEKLVEFDTAQQHRIATFCEEPRAAYDRVGLTSFFAHRDAEKLMLARMPDQRSGPLTRELLLVPGQFGLGQVPAKHKPDATTSMICGYCSTGCSLNIHLQKGRAVSLTPTSNYPVNLGMARPKGWEALSVLNTPDRATAPLLRNSSGRLEPVTWDAALSTFVDRFKSIQAEHGDDAVAFLSTGQIPTEEMAFLGALAKFGMGLVHGDGNTRQCMATAVVAYKQAFGFDAPPYTYKDFEVSDVIVLVGSNLCIAHPILWERVLCNPHNPRIIVLDPRCTETTMQAT